jgi:hypothetical protein
MTTAARRSRRRLAYQMGSAAAGCASVKGIEEQCSA